MSDEQDCPCGGFDCSSLPGGPLHGCPYVPARRWHAIDEIGNDNFATSIYEAGDKGLLVARCNQNGQYPWQGPAIIRGLEANVGNVSVEILDIERAVSDDLRKQNDKFRKHAGRYGFVDELEMNYENMQQTAAAVIKGRRRPA